MKRFKKNSSSKITSYFKKETVNSKQNEKEEGEMPKKPAEEVCEKLSMSPVPEESQEVEPPSWPAPELRMLEADKFREPSPEEEDTTKESSLPVQYKPFPVKSFKDTKRVHQFVKGWYNSFPWLHYVSDDIGVVCYECLKAHKAGYLSTMNQRLTFISEGFRNWKKAYEKFKIHAASDMHSEATIKNAEAAKCLPVVTQISKHIQHQQMRARVALHALITTLRYLAMQGLAVRGKDDISSNFCELLELRSGDIPELSEFLERKKTYTSWKIQNEILELMANFVIRQILNEVRNQQFFSLIVDETTDEAKHEQVTICIRSVDKSLNVSEYFLGLYETSSTTSEALKNLIIDALQRFSLPVEKLRGQCYDGASNMKGIHNGVQAKIRSIQPLALYVHCTNHSLNLALQDCSRAVPLMKNCLQWVHDVGVITGTSKRRAEFADICESFGDVPLIHPKTLCPTRWTVRVKAIITALRTYQAILTMMLRLGKAGIDISSTAMGLHSQLRKSEVYLGLLIAREVFEPTERLALAIETPQGTVSGALNAAEKTIDYLNSLRTEEKFSELWDEMLKAEEDYSLIACTMPRKRKAPKKFDHISSPTEGIEFESPKEMHRKTYYEVLDTIMNQMKERFSQSGLAKVKLLESTLLSPVAEWENDKNIQGEITANGIDWDSFIQEMKMFPRLFDGKMPCYIGDMQKLYESLPLQTKQLFPCVWKLLSLLLVIPATTATCERSFSTMKRVKTYLRSTMTQRRLNHLCILHVYNEMTKSINVEEIASEFCKLNESRVSVFGK